MNWNWTVIPITLSVIFSIIGIVLYFKTWKFFDAGEYRVSSEARALSIVCLILAWSLLFFMILFS